MERCNKEPSPEMEKFPGYIAQTAINKREVNPLSPQFSAISLGNVESPSTSNTSLFQFITAPSCSIHCSIANSSLLFPR